MCSTCTPCAYMTWNDTQPRKSVALCCALVSTATSILFCTTETNGGGKLSRPVYITLLSKRCVTELIFVRASAILKRPSIHMSTSSSPESKNHELSVPSAFVNILSIRAMFWWCRGAIFSPRAGHAEHVPLATKTWGINLYGTPCHLRRLMPRSPWYTNSI